MWRCVTVPASDSPWDLFWSAVQPAQHVTLGLNMLSEALSTVLALINQRPAYHSAVSQHWR